MQIENEPCGYVPTKVRKLCMKNYVSMCLIDLTAGPLGPEAKMLLKDLGRRLQRRTGDSMATYYLSQQVSIAIQRGNNFAILGTMRQSNSEMPLFHIYIYIYIYIYINTGTCLIWHL